MKKIITAMVAMAFVCSTVLPASANNDTAWFLGGMVGGLVLGEVLDGPRPYPPAYPSGRYYVYDEPVYEKQCYSRWVKRWSEYKQTWVKVRKTRCEWVRVY